MAPEFDYVIVGAGSAGCVLANRLSEDTATKVLLLEAGGRDSSMWIDIPAGFEVVMNTASINWGYESEPETHLDGRVIDTPRGKVLGGSSSINGMMFVRGNPLDYENWVEMGAAGWSYPEVLPYFKRSESFAGGGDDYRGGDGPLLTRQGSLESPLYRVFFEAAKEAGYLATPDHNGYQQEGFGPTSMSVNSARRCSTARGYLHPIRHRNNLKVETDALVSKLAVTGNRVGGVVYEQAGTRTEVAANREVILSAGSFNSPKLMMLSGLRPAPLLKEHGIAVKQSLPGVGENLIDHMGATVQVECAQPVSVQPATHGLGRLGAGLRWMVFKSGPAASNQLEGSGFIRTEPGSATPICSSTSCRWPERKAATVTYRRRTVINCIADPCARIAAAGSGLRQTTHVRDPASLTTILPRTKTGLICETRSGLLARSSINQHSTGIENARSNRVLRSRATRISMAG